MLPRVGISANFFHPDAQRPLYKGKTLVFAEESLINWIVSGPALPILVPRDMGSVDMKTIVSQLDGIVFSGGSDISPLYYGETPLRDEWRGDPARDEYEIDLFQKAIETNKPVFGICRGMQLINVALGGSLYQDTVTQKPGASQHRDWSVYDQLKHPVRIKSTSTLAKLFPATTQALVNSVHHQAIKRLADAGQYKLLPYMTTLSRQSKSKAIKMADSFLPSNGIPSGGKIRK